MTETDEAPWLLEIRLFTVAPGRREEFHRVSGDGTVPLMRECGITVLAHGPSLNDEDGYYLLRAFRSEEERVALSQSVYATEVWLRKYDEVVPAMMTGYQTSVVPVPRAALTEFARALGLG
ncbi:NIPSNAP family protein [Streptomyces sp. CHA1]|uniref:NIPSNAP family protein n=1 Tax=unclassified Streptomyces TaxID=2593676 RepID=UPI001BFCAC42|nr:MULTISPECIES: NIPSNAP family protein [unclassified Streptomyces]MBT3157586.1 NIPSNAP family protein [Streptomyces sp. G11C]MCO6701421.1 NIPSNAP family protein [Streptomyces sp. CHB9.2]MCO6707674.1 NIPSNAP family protein [Streptomyces sp. CHA3]MCO6713414.1 NIPSNAP family protein [Streptomyces sp. CHB19.2]MCO6719744.1 NIPSNAP family protein [Streptomyces sp. Vc714c-19]